jgi:hypothetical protein
MNKVELSQEGEGDKIPSGPAHRRRSAANASLLVFVLATSIPPLVAALIILPIRKLQDYLI